ncbi:MAG: hypothetical protein ABTB30_14370, partial [Clostridia bacterium]
ADLNALFSGQVNTCNACHVSIYTSVCLEKIPITFGKERFRRRPGQPNPDRGLTAAPLRAVVTQAHNNTTPPLFGRNGRPVPDRDGLVSPGTRDF